MQIFLHMINIETFLIVTTDIRILNYEKFLFAKINIWLHEKDPDAKKY